MSFTLSKNSIIRLLKNNNTFIDINLDDVRIITVAGKNNKLIRYNICSNLDDIERNDIATEDYDSFYLRYCNFFEEHTKKEIVAFYNYVFDKHKKNKKVNEKEDILKKIYDLFCKKASNPKNDFIGFFDKIVHDFDFFLKTAIEYEENGKKSN